MEFQSVQLSFCKVRSVKSPAKANNHDAGIDFFIPEGLGALDYHIEPGKDLLIPSGIKVNIPAGWCLTFFNKSGRSTKNKLVVGAQVVDSGYQGEVHLHVFNLHPFDTVILEPGQKLVQGLLMQVPILNIVEAENDLLYSEASDRGTGGFGSTDNPPVNFPELKWPFQP